MRLDWERVGIYRVIYNAYFIIGKRLKPCMIEAIVLHKVIKDHVQFKASPYNMYP